MKGKSKSPIIADDGKDDGPAMVLSALWRTPPRQNNDFVIFDTPTMWDSMHSNGTGDLPGRHPLIGVWTIKARCALRPDALQ
jgi:hypothetical protein